MRFRQSLLEAVSLLEQSTPATLREADHVLRGALALASTDVDIANAENKSLVQRIARLLRNAHSFYAGVAALRERCCPVYSPSGLISNGDAAPSFTWEA